VGFFLVLSQPVLSERVYAEQSRSKGKGCFVQDPGQGRLNGFIKKMSGSAGQLTEVYCRQLGCC